MFEVGDKVFCVRPSIRRNYLVEGNVYTVRGVKTRGHNGVRELPPVVQVDPYVDWWDATRFTKKLTNEERMKLRKEELNET